MGSRCPQCLSSTNQSKYIHCNQGHATFVFKVLSSESSSQQKFQCNQCNQFGHSSVLVCKKCNYQICTTTCFKGKHNEICKSHKWTYPKSEVNKSGKLKCSFCKFCPQSYLCCKSCSAISCGGCFILSQWPCSCIFVYNQQRNLSCIYCDSKNKTSIGFCSKCQLPVCTDCYDKKYKK